MNFMRIDLTDPKGLFLHTASVKYVATLKTNQRRAGKNFCIQGLLS